MRDTVGIKSGPFLLGTYSNPIGNHLESRAPVSGSPRGNRMKSENMSCQGLNPSKILHTVTLIAVVQLDLNASLSVWNQLGFLIRSKATWIDCRSIQQPN
eukprot:6654377-Pyramimonas_sp.AAC.1